MATNEVNWSNDPPTFFRDKRWIQRQHEAARQHEQPQLTLDAAEARLAAARDSYVEARRRAASQPPAQREQIIAPAREAYWAMRREVDRHRGG